MQIAAHAVHMKATLISSDKAFLKIAHLQTEDWSLVGVRSK
jgi:predicted nucleic acid-binding protein